MTAYPSPGNHTKYIKKLYKSFDIDHMKEVLTKFSSFRTRYYRSETGKQSQKWLLSQILEIASKHKGMSVQEFPHAWGQNSIIVRFPSAKKASKDEGPVTILGAHQDSTNSWPFLPAPCVG
jgi:leucyl aminopeptidase